MAKVLESILARVQPSDLDLSSKGIAEARANFRDFSTKFVGVGHKGEDIVGGRNPYFLTRSSAKLDLNESAPETAGYKQSIVYAAPANSANEAIRRNNELRGERGESSIPLVNACACSTPGCRKACLSQSGRLGVGAGHHAQAVRTAFMAAHPEHALTLLHAGIATAQNRAAKLGVTPVIRLNGTTDIAFDELPTADTFFRDFGRENVQYNEYTKENTRGALSEAELAQEHQRFKNTPNLYVVHSMNELTTPERIRQITSSGRNFAVPVGVSSDHPIFNEHKTAMLPGVKFHFGDDEYDAINGYRSDMRFLDPQGGHAVVLPAKELTGGREQPIPGAESFIRSADLLSHHGLRLGQVVNLRYGSRNSRRS